MNPDEMPVLFPDDDGENDDEGDDKTFAELMKRVAASFERRTKPESYYRKAESDGEDK